MIRLHGVERIELGAPVLRSGQWVRVLTATNANSMQQRIEFLASSAAALRIEDIDQLREHVRELQSDLQVAHQELLAAERRNGGTA